MSHAYKNQRSQPFASVHPPLSLQPVSRHVDYSLMLWRAFILKKGTIDFQLKVWIRCSKLWNSRNTRSALTFLSYLLNRQTSLGCLTDTQSHLLHKSQISAERSLLQACQDKQNMVDYMYTLQPNSMHLWTQSIQNRLAQRKTWRETLAQGESIKITTGVICFFASQLEMAVCQIPCKPCSSALEWAELRSTSDRFYWEESSMLAC